MAVSLVCIAIVLPLKVTAETERIATPQSVGLSVVGRISTGHFDLGSSEIPAYHPQTKRLFVVNGAEGLDIIDLSDPAQPTRVGVRRMQHPTSVAIHGDLIAVASIPKGHGTRGSVRFLDPQGAELARVEVGFGPDMIAFTPDGLTLLVACEGEPSTTDPSIDPPGSIAFVDLSRGVGDARVVEAGFASFEPQRAALIARGLRVVDSKKPLAQDMEPEYIALSPCGRLAFVTLQENNAVAIVDVATRTVRSIEPLGFRDCSQAGMGFDAIDDGVAAPRPVPVLAMFQPDAIVAFEHDGALWLATANEGEAREKPFMEAVSLQQARTLLGVGDGVILPEARLWVSCVRAPESAGGGLCAFGTRSVSIWRVSEDAHAPAITLAWDSGDGIERLVAERTPEFFNADHRSTARIDARSLWKGPEPEGIAFGEVSGRRLLFVTLERSGGVVIVDATDPRAASIAGHSNERRTGVDLSVNLDRNGVPDALDDAGDLGPEGLIFIPASESPTGRPMLVVCNEVSGTTTLFHINAE